MTNNWCLWTKAGWDYDREIMTMLFEKHNHDADLPKPQPVSFTENNLQRILLIEQINQAKKAGSFTAVKILRKQLDKLI